MLGLLVVGRLGVSSVAELAGASVAPALISFANLMMFVLTLLFAWLKFGKDILPARTIASKLPLIAQRLVLYGQMFLGRTANQWIRTDRGRSD